MNDPSSRSILPTESIPENYPPPARALWSTGEIISWALLLVCVAVTLYFSTIAQNRPENSGRDLQFRVVARYVIGLKTLAANSPVLQAAQLTALADQQAIEPREHFRAAILAGEIEGRDAARSRLDSLYSASSELHPDIDTLRQIYDTGTTPSRLD